MQENVKGWDTWQDWIAEIVDSKVRAGDWKTSKIKWETKSLTQVPEDKHAIDDKIR
jgi:hypothetical protein